MNKLLLSILVFTTMIAVEKYDYSTKAAVSLGGGIVAAQSVNINKKYKRKDCPICKGTGWYISGDGIEKVSCGYCEPVNTGIVTEQPNCTTKTCPTPQGKK